MRALILADGDAPTRGGLDAAWPGWDAGVELVIAADGGARLADALGLTIDRWVGDGDSLGEGGLEALRQAGIPIDLSPVDKDESDTELALAAALDAGADDVVVLAALGGRLDHALANVQLLAHPRLAGRAAELLSEQARVRLIVGPGSIDLSGRLGDVVSLLPLGERAVGLVTEGLRYPLHDEPLELGPARGLSNVRTGADASVRLREGRVLVIETPATLGR